MYSLLTLHPIVEKMLELLWNSRYEESRYHVFNILSCSPLILAVLNMHISSLASVQNTFSFTCLSEMLSAAIIGVTNK